LCRRVVRRTSISTPYQDGVTTLHIKDGACVRSQKSAEMTENMALVVIRRFEEETQRTHIVFFFGDVELSREEDSTFVTWNIPDGVILTVRQAPAPDANRKREDSPSPDDMKKTPKPSPFHLAAENGHESLHLTEVRGHAGIATLIRNKKHKGDDRGQKDGLLQASPEEIKNNLKMRRSSPVSCTVKS
jgi:hypothetical protein